MIRHRPVHLFRRAVADRRVRPLLDWIGQPWRSQATQTYAAILVSTSLFLHATHQRLAQEALRTASTNLDRLARQPITALITSACWIEPNGVAPYVVLVATFVLILAPLEARIGSLRWLAGFAAGHIGATLVVAVGLRVALDAGWVQTSVARSIDVGWSYGGLSLAAALTFVLPASRRRPYAAVLVALRLWALRQPNYTEFGHLVAVAIGFGLGPWMARNRPVPAFSAPAR